MIAIKAVKVLAPLGMVAALCYIGHSILGTLLWSEYDPITMRIGILTADGAPNASFLRAFTIAYGISQALFGLGMMLVAFKWYHTMLRVGCTTLFIMSLISLFGFGLFHMDVNTQNVSSQEGMHNVVYFVVALTTMIAMYCIAMGCLEQEKMRRLGVLSIVMTALVAALGVFHSLAAAQQWPITGLTERLSNYSFEIFTFIFSYLFTFVIDVQTGKAKTPGVVL